MSDMHVLTGDGSRWQVIGHAAVPASPPNEAGVSFRTALVNAGLAVTQMDVIGDGSKGTITQVEHDAIAAGEVYEFPFVVLLESGGAESVKRAATARAKYAEVKGEKFAEMQVTLRHFGQTLEATP